MGNDFVEGGVPAFGAYNKQLGMRGLALPWNDELFARLNVRYRNETVPAFGNREVIPFLAGLWYDIGKRTPDIRYDYMDIVTTLYQHNFCRPLQARVGLTNLPARSILESEMRA